MLRRRRSTDGGVQSNRHSATETNPGQGTVGEQGKSADAAAVTGESLPGLPRSSRIPSLCWRLTILTALIVAMSVGLVTPAVFFTVQAALYREMDSNLHSQAEKLLMSPYASEFAIGPSFEADSNRILNPDLDAVYFAHGGVAGKGGGSISISGPGLMVLRGSRRESIRTNEYNGRRMYAVRSEDGATLILSRDLSSTQLALKTLSTVLLNISTIGILFVIGPDITVATTGLRPVTRLRIAAGRAMETDELRPIPVKGDDGLARFTRSFNEMLAAPQASRIKQTELVVDAGHELKAPLTSLRTNIKLLMMASRSGAAISDEDRTDLEADVIAQLGELSTLVGDLVDLARGDGPQWIIEHVDVDHNISTSLACVERRRSDIIFGVQTVPWYVYGDSAGLGRAILDLMDDVAKWSPENNTVRARLAPLGEVVTEFTVADSGPDIPKEDRDKVFECFYCSIQSRSMPGSGLGLTIVKSVIVRHGGTVATDESDDGGALMRVTLPGNPHSRKGEDPNSAQESSQKRITPRQS